MADRKTRTGIELDGNTAVVVTAVGGQAIQARVFTGDSPSAALSSALSAVGKDEPVRVVAVPASSVVRRWDMTAAMTDRTTFERAVKEKIGNDPLAGATLAGLFFDHKALVGTTLGGGMFAAAPAEPVERAYRALGRRPAEVVHPAFASGDENGVLVAIRDTVADLTLTLDGHVVANRILVGKGLDALRSRLGQTADGPDLLTKALDHPGADPACAAEIADYTREIARDVASTLSSWASVEGSITREVAIYGPGAALPGLVGALSDVDVAVRESQLLTVGLSRLEPTLRRRAGAAFLATASMGTGGPIVAFPNPAATEWAKSRQSRRRTIKVAAALTGVGLGLLALIAGPIASGRLSLSQANAAKAAAKARLAATGDLNVKVAELDSLHDAYNSITGADPAWSQVMATVYNTAPAGSVIDNFAATHTGSVLTVTVQARLCGDFTSVTSWLGKLRTQPGVSDAWPSNFTSKASTTTTTSCPAEVTKTAEASLTFTIDAAKVSPARPVETRGAAK